MPGPIEEGQEFVDFAAFKVAMQDWAVGGAHKFTFRYQRSDATRNVVICVHQDCPFRVSATFNKTLGCVKVAKVKDEHICVRVAPVGQAASSNQRVHSASSASLSDQVSVVLLLNILGA